VTAPELGAGGGQIPDTVRQAKFKLESWPEMVHYASESNYAIKFDMKKFYHQIQINSNYTTYFGFKYQMRDGIDTFFEWKTMPYGYTRALYTAKQLMRPLIAKWRGLGAKTVVFYDDGMAVAESDIYLSSLSLQMQCDLLKAGLVPGATKCVWEPVKLIDWNGLTFDFNKSGFCIKQARIDKLSKNLAELISVWPKVTFREVAQCTGELIQCTRYWAKSCKSEPKCCKL
jgi:hypothetical protein